MTTTIAKLGVRALLVLGALDAYAHADDSAPCATTAVGPVFSWNGGGTFLGRTSVTTWSGTGHYPSGSSSASATWDPYP